MSRYLDYSRGISAKLDVLSVIGIGLAVFAGALFVSAVLPAHEEVERLRTRVVAARSAPANQSSESEAAARGRSQLAMFTRNFPTLSEAPGWVLRIHQIAARNELALETGEYRLLNSKDGGLARYQITLPLRGGYAQVRTFLEQVLTQIPAAALEEVTIKRDSVGAQATETRVRLTLYLADAK